MWAVYILIIVIAGMAASFLFGKLAKEKGYPTAKARRYPILLMVASLIISIVLLATMFVLGSMMKDMRNILLMMHSVGNWFLIAVYLVVLNKAYNNMKLAPDAEKLRERLQALQKERAGQEDEGKV